MANLFKKSMSFVFALAFIMGINTVTPSLVYADSNEENVSYHKVHNSAFGVDVNVKDGVDISEKSITSILANVNKSDRGNVTIVFVKKIPPKKTKNEYKSNLIMPRGSSFYYTKHIEDDSYITNKKYLTSVAKGMTSTLSSAVTMSADVKVKGSVEANFLEFVKGKIESEFGTGISETISTTYEFTGPPESSEYNSRIYYAGIINDKGYYKVWKWRNDKKIVRFTIPKEMVIYNVDKKIK